MALSKRFKIYVFDKAICDLDDAITYYNSKQNGLGFKFYLEYKKMLKVLKINPYYRVFYDDIHCLKIHNFPYLIHFTIDKLNKLVLIEAVICTYQNPEDAYIK